MEYSWLLLHIPWVPVSQFPLCVDLQTVRGPVIHVSLHSVQVVQLGVDSFHVEYAYI